MMIDNNSSGYLTVLLSSTVNFQALNPEPVQASVAEVEKLLKWASDRESRLAKLRKEKEGREEAIFG